MPEVVVDTNVLVAMVDEKDNWHGKTESLVKQLENEQNIRLVYFDCVLNETVSVLARRMEEQKRLNEFPSLLGMIHTRIPVDLIVWISADIRRLYAEIIRLVKQTAGALNFHDALIALKCKEFGIGSVLSFDKDFDLLDWIRRIS